MEGTGEREATREGRTAGVRGRREEEGKRGRRRGESGEKKEKAYGGELKL